MAMSMNREFLSLAAAAKFLGATKGKVKIYAARRLVGVQRLPELPTRYSRADLIALRDRCTVPAEVIDERELVEA
jgi:hypothetical protein